MGFDHVAIAAGAGKPTIIDVKNNLIRGVRKASDFLMALQLTGGFKRDSLANLQVRLPAHRDRRRPDRHRHHHRGGGLLPGAGREVPRALGGAGGRAAATRRCSRAATTPRRREIAREFLEHGRAVRAERARAAAAGEAPDFAPLVGGVGRRLAGLPHAAWRTARPIA